MDHPQSKKCLNQTWKFQFVCFQIQLNSLANLQTPQLATKLIQ